MQNSEFEALCGMARRVLDGVYSALPANLREAAEQVPVFLERLAPSPDEDLLGLFEGASLAEEMSGPEDRPRISLFLEAICDFVEGDAEAFEDEVRITVLHELGHYFGWDEDEIEARGLG